MDENKSSKDLVFDTKKQCYRFKLPAWEQVAVWNDLFCEESDYKVSDFEIPLTWSNV